MEAVFRCGNWRNCTVCKKMKKYPVQFRFSWRGLWRGFKSMRPTIGFDWYWKFGLFIHWTDPQSEKSKGVALHFEKAGLAFGPLWLGVKDKD